VGACVNDMAQLQVAQDRSVLLYGTLDGALGCLLPVPEKSFRRLFALQAAMSSSPLVPRNAGLNPRAYRTTRYHLPLQRQRQRNVADGALLWSFTGLDGLAQRQLARLVGTTPETIFQDLLELDHIIFTVAL
jgi:cleavage and polyadenylation specificity factor subunit 1